MQQVAADPRLPSTEHVECVATAVETIFSSLLGEPPVKTNEEATLEVLKCDGVVGVIGLVGDVEWGLVVGIPRETAPKLAEGFTGFEIPFESDDMGDAVGELANLVAGEAKVNLDGLGVASEISLPQVFRGEGIEVLRPPQVPFSGPGASGGHAEGRFPAQPRPGGAGAPLSGRSGRGRGRAGRSSPCA